ncbi:MAG: hypothetical protein F6K44_09230 [Moorea sp. SIO3E2]|uniref:hypothetical protein n=1 Tax=Moorena sp. SIO4E2 TaxID=2607826 RepID=UPI0013BC8D70|nr:hypothetical protein [Moorena sp. SIO4E2]NEQ05382.1 hypothetical protein [Moorena sp. SIO4E2]NEQ14034.1 hypothetical protein [Moorena sp. SIO3E2]
MAYWPRYANNLQPANLGLLATLREQPTLQGTPKANNLQNEPNKEPPELGPGGVWCEE